jgi:uncharacterized protein (TIGR02996 family)
MKKKGAGAVADADEQERGFLLALEEKPDDVPTLLAYADWLEEHGRPYRAMLRRVQAGVSQVRYKIRRKSDGLFADSGGMRVSWSAGGKEWEKLSSVRAHLAVGSSNDKYGTNTPWEDVEIVAIEVRVHVVGTVPFSLGEKTGSAPWRQQRKVTITEPE